MIVLRHLRLVGPAKNFDVSFIDEHARIRSLSVIAGEISTGKTSILDFVDYCLGATSHPTQIEVQRQARSALLELELSGELHVIERPLFARESWVWLHRATLSKFSEPHETIKLPVGPAGDSRSLNWLLLRHCGLEGVVLKEAPTKPVSETDPVSFRDVMWLAYLSDDRLLGKHLLHEITPMKHLKLRQLVEVIFGVHDQQLAALGDQIKHVEEERAAQQHEIEALETFLHEQEVPPRLDLLAKSNEAASNASALDARLGDLESHMRAATTYAESARARYTKTRRTSSEVATRVRDRDVLLRRLLPLRGQYAEDERKLVFFSEARRLFDPLRVTVCPSCLQRLEVPATIKDETCTLCHQELEPVSNEAPIDVEAERAAIRVRLRALDVYITEVEDQLRADRIALEAAERDEHAAQAALDSDLSEKLSPYVAERDRLVRMAEVNAALERDLARQVGWWDAVQRRRGQREDLDTRVAELREQQRKLELGRPNRDAVVANLSRRFDALLRAFSFPKLDDPEPPYIDDRFVPHVRGVSYDQLRSRGATTLVAVAWQLAIFEQAIEEGAPHPGFLMIDSPQSGLKPLEGHDGDEFAVPEISERLWAHLLAWSKGDGAGAQIIVVENLPPATVDQNVVVRYSGDPSRPPYGFIDNETGVSTPVPSGESGP